jgi:hypothetical protein
MISGHAFNQWRKTVFALFFAGIGLAVAGVVRGDEPGAVFGEESKSTAALVGVLYDLKQTQDHTATSVDANSYSKVVQEFLIKNWDESVLNRYYRVSKPLYTTQIFIPNMDAGLAPKAFGAEKTVQPSRWVVHYKGQVSPPTEGTYRFWGCADDAFAAAVNGKTVLVACRPDMAVAMTDITWKSTEKPGAQAADDPLIAGDWFTVKQGEIIDLDVLIGERPGGLFNAFFMVEKQGETYEKDAQGNPILPIFQVAAYDTPSDSDLNKQPRFATGFPPWKCYQ